MPRMAELKSTAINYIYIPVSFKNKINYREWFQPMRCFNFKCPCVVGGVMLAGILYMPLLSLATESSPEGVASAPVTVPVSPPAIHSATVMSVSAEEWNAHERQSRSSEPFLMLPGLLTVMQTVVQQPDSGVVLHYPENERGEVWVEELRDWLVALGLSSNRIQLIPGSNGDVINISQVVLMQNPANAQKPLSSPPVIITEPFPIKEATDTINGVEIP